MPAENSAENGITDKRAEFGRTDAWKSRISPFFPYRPHFICIFPGIRRSNENIQSSTSTSTWSWVMYVTLVCSLCTVGHSAVTILIPVPLCSLINRLVHFAISTLWLYSLCIMHTCLSKSYDNIIIFMSFLCLSTILDIACSHPIYILIM